MSRAVTRGDGVQGDDVTDNVEKPSVVFRLILHGEGYPSEFEIRGEILMPWEVFEELNREREAREEPLFCQSAQCCFGNAETAELCYRGFSQVGCLPILFIR